MPSKFEILFVMRPTRKQIWLINSFSRIYLVLLASSVGNFDKNLSENGATTFSIMTLSIMTLSIMTLSIMALSITTLVK